MLRRDLFPALLIGFLLVPDLRAQAEEPLSEAHNAFIHGRYEEALRLYDEAVETGEDPVAAVLGKATVLRETGGYDEAEKVLESALSEFARDPALLAEQADYHFFRGRWDECEARVHAALEADPDHLRAHMIMGRLAEARGDRELAAEHFDHLFMYYNSVASVTQPEELLYVSRAAIFFRTFHDANRVLNEAVKEHPEFLPALVERGFLFLRTHGEPRARGMFEDVLLVNENHPEAHLGIAESHLSEGDFPEAQEPLEKALETNPSLPGALRARALMELYDLEYDKALETLRAALEVNPKDLEALGLAAFCERARGNREAEKELEDRAFAVRESPVAFFNAAGEACAFKRWSIEADEYFARALELDPEDGRALGNHGMVLMRLGREQEAGDVLDRAFQRDRFDKRVYNLRIVLKDMEQFPLRETEHFQIKMPREKDPVLGELLSLKAEEAFAELERELGFTPDLPVIFEVFEDRGIFAARVTGMPRGIPTAVCLGPVIAMQCPPSGRHEDEAFQWYHVLRHELAHVFTLAWTKNRIPRWFTEGISVHYEGSSRVRHDSALSAAMASERLLEIEHLNRGFTRPDYPGQVSNSYAQSGLVVRMIVERWGMEMLAKMLSLFAEGKTTEHVIPDSTGLSLDEFNTAMFDYLDRVLHEERRARPQLDPSRLDYYHRRIDRSPDDADLHLRAGRLHLVKEEYSDAREHAEEALDLEEDHAEALELMARIAFESKEEDEAMAFAQRALEAGGERYYPRLIFGLVHESRGETEQAIEEFEKAKSIRPRFVWKNNPYEKLAKLYEETGRTDRALAVRAELLDLRETDFLGNIELARAYLKEGTREEAIRLLERTLEIVPFNARVHGMLGKAFLDEGSTEEALRILSWAVELEPDDALYRLDLATVCSRLGKRDEALEHATEAARLDPDLTEAKELIEELGG